MANHYDVRAGVEDTNALALAFTRIARENGRRLQQVWTHLSGGERPGADLALTLPPGGGGYTPTMWGAFPRDGTAQGMLARPGVDSRRIVYRLPGDPAAEAELNRSAFRVAADPQANLRRRDGLRWIPVLPAQVSVPVVSIHTLGDGYVWFSMQQDCTRRADAAGTADRLVQRATRGLGHCDFTLAEEEEAFDAMTAWVRFGRRPNGDDVLDPATLASPTYGCRFSRTPRDEDAPLVKTLRSRLPACPEGSAARAFGG